MTVVDDFAAMYPRLRAFAAVVGPAEVEPDDLVQEALEKLLRRRAQAEVHEAEAYVRASIVNLASNRRRSLGRWRRVSARLRSASSEDRTTYPSDLSDLTRLSPRVRAVIWMVDIEGASYAEVATALGCSEEAARARASRGRAELRAAFNTEELR